MKREINIFGIILSVFVVGAIVVVSSGFSTNVGDSPRRESTSLQRRAPIISPMPGEFPIVASSVFNNLTGPKKGDLDGVKECGFNLCMHASSADRLEQLLGYMEGTGLKILLQDNSFQINSADEKDKWKKVIPDFVNKFKNNPLVAGWKFYDEPKWEHLVELKQRYDLLMDTDSTHFVYINLVGEIVKSHTGPCGTLGEYLDSIQNMLPMDVWSSDFYPIMIRNGNFIVNYEKFYDDLEAYSIKTKETGIPMWAYCESMEYRSRHHYRPAATVPYLSFEAFSALAYGAQGLVYWTYWQRPSTPYETYISALVDMNGNKTRAWYAAQSVNRQIRALTPVFLGAEMVECRHTGNIPLRNVRPFITQFGPLEMLRNGDKGVLVSHLRNGDNNYLLIVNHDVQNKQKVRISLKKDVSVSELSVNSSGILTRKDVKGRFSVILLPGGYSIFEWE